MEIKIIDAKRREAPTSGYGLMSEQFSERLKQYGHEIHYFDVEPTRRADLWLWLRPPHYIKEPYFNADNFNVFFTMHEQETFEGWKKDWPELLNKCKAIITPTEWNKKVFIDNGVKVPIYVVPLGVDEKTFRGYKNRRFSILSAFDGLGSGGSRENWRENTEAFYQTFYKNHNDEVIYNIKSWRVDYFAWVNWRKNLIKKKGYNAEDLPEIAVYEIDLVPEDLNLFYAKNHVFLKNSSGEGWSLPTLEAWASGLHIISRPTPAMLAYLNEDNCSFYNDQAELGAKIWEAYRRWRKERVSVDLFSWREATRKLNDTIKQIFHL